jgi:hypothetical protein
MKTTRTNSVQLIIFILKEQNLKKAEVCAYFNMFDEAESIYLEMDRK